MSIRANRPMAETAEMTARATRQNEVCKTLITIDLAVVAATLSILGSSRPITALIGSGAVLLVIASVAFVISMLCLINEANTDSWISRIAFGAGLVLTLAGYLLMLLGFRNLEPPTPDERISIEAQPNGMTLHVPGLCRQAVTATLPTGKARIIPSPGPAQTANQGSECRANWRLEVELRPGGQLVVQPTP